MGIFLFASSLTFSSNSAETAMSFGSPGGRGSQHKAQPISNQAKYRYLESNQALPHPLKVQNRSEVQNNYTPPFKDGDEYLAKKLEGLGNRNERIQDNKRTHYVPGYHPPQMKSEQVSLGSLYERWLLAMLISRLHSSAPRSLCILLKWQLVS